MLTDVEQIRIANITTPAWTVLRYHPQQNAIWRARDRFPVAVAGRQSGKTEIFRRLLVRWLAVRKPWADPKYFYGLPTFDQAKRVVWDQINALIPNEWVVKNGRNRSELCVTTKFGSKLYVVGLDKPQRIEGETIDGGVIDECSDQRPEVYSKTVLPMLAHRNGWCARIGVPKRNGCGAVDFRAAYDAGLLLNDLGIKSYSWRSETILSEEQLRQIKGQLTTKDTEEQLGGVWVSADGQVFYAFDEANNVSSVAEYNPFDVIGVGSDFNVDPMAWVLFHIRDGKMYVFDEIWQRNTNTQKTLDYLYQQYGFHTGGWMFFGDASSKNRHSSTNFTDYAQIANDKRFDQHIHKRIDYPLANPAVADRFAATNSMLCNGLGNRRLFINPKCKNLRSDLTQRSYKKGTRDVDDSGDVGHITDALGYPVHSLFPIRMQFADQGVNATQPDYVEQIADTFDVGTSVPGVDLSKIDLSRLLRSVR